MAIWTKLVGDPNARVRRQLEQAATGVAAEEAAVAQLSDDGLKAALADLRRQVQAGAALDQVKNKSFALTREAAKRQLGQRHYDVQVMGGLVLHEGHIA